MGGRRRRGRKIRRATGINSIERETACATSHIAFGDPVAMYEIIIFSLYFRFRPHFHPPLNSSKLLERGQRGACWTRSRVAARHRRDRRRHSIDHIKRVASTCDALANRADSKSETGNFVAPTANSSSANRRLVCKSPRSHIEFSIL